MSMEIIENLVEEREPIPSLPVEALPAAPSASPEASPTPEVSIYTSSHRTFGEEVRVLSKQLHTAVYLGKGFITEAELNPFGIYDDPYTGRSKYYYVQNGKKLASARVIAADKKDGIMSLPTAKEFSVDASRLETAAGITNIATLKPSEVVEISGLASKRVEGGAPKGDEDFDAVISMYSKMMRDSLEAGHKLWLLNTDAGLIRHFGMLMGENQVHVLGEPKEYMGPPTIPAAISPQQVMREIFGNNTDGKYDFHIMHLREIFKDINADNIPRDIQDLFDQHGVEFDRPSKFHLSKGEMTVQGLVMAYSVSRALPAAGVEEFDGSPAALWGIDVATSVPYAWGVTKMYAGKTVKEKAIGASVAVPTFLAPYAYFYAEAGQNYPGYVNAIASGMIGLAVAKEIAGRKLQARKGRKLSQQLAATKD